MKTSMRTHNCGELRLKDVNKEVTLIGWVKKIRTHGKITFIDLYDRYGTTQLIINEPIAFSKESVLQIRGIVKERIEKNKNLETGDIEIDVTNYKLITSADKIPIDLSEKTTTNEENRLRFRYLDLRRRQMQQNLILRHKITKKVRDFLDNLNFVEIETPLLSKSTPEGARDYLVPSRLYPGKFYALPQSPQQYKQLLMISGFDRYFQIARCFRDEDLRADRQPDFTQIDIEMSFINEEDIFETTEQMIQKIMKLKDFELKLPLKRISYNDAMNRYGSDKPDLRFKLELFDVTDNFKHSSFNIFKNIVESGGVVKAINFKKGAKLSRKQIQKLEKIAKNNGAKGMSYIKIANEVTGSIAKYWNELNISAEKGDLILFVADKFKTCVESLGKVRLEIFKIVKEDDELKEYYANHNYFGEKYELLWITDFPLFSWSDEENKFVSEHHPFTAPSKEYIEKLKNKDIETLNNLNNIKSRSYDLVFNGYELASGSIRIHDPELQQSIFEILGLKKEDIDNKFGHLVEAFKYGAPPHGGIALGLDRLTAILSNETNIREVIAFPKNKNAINPMEESPSNVSNKQLKELHISIN